MASTYSPYLRLELIGTGDQTGTWGNTTNTNLGTLLDQAVAGTATIDVTLGDVTLTTLNGASDQSRQAILKITGTPNAARNVIAPESSKWYLVSNDCGQTITLKGASTTGYAIADGATLLMFWDGTDFVPGSSIALGYTPVNKAGDTMLGNLILNAAPSTTLGAATKGYVDDAVSGAVGGNFVLKAGDTMTGPLVLPGAPTLTNQASTKGYVDNSIANAGFATQSWVTSQNYATNTTQSLQYYYTKTDSDSRYVSVNTQSLTYYPLSTTVAATYATIASLNNYVTTSYLTSNYSTSAQISSALSYYAPLAGTNTWSAVNTFSATPVSGTIGAVNVTQGGASSPTLYLYNSAGGDAERGGEIKMTNFNASSGVRNKFLRVAQTGQFQIIDSAYTGYLLTLDNGANFAVGGNITTTNGEGYKPGGGTWAAYSDSRLKENAQPLTGALDKITALNPVTYQWKYDTTEPTVGFIAQEVKQILPTAISETDPTEKVKYMFEDGEKVLSLGWKNDMMAYLVGAIKELKAEIDALKADK